MWILARWWLDCWRSVIFKTIPFIISNQNSDWIETELKILLHRKLHFWVVIIEKRIINKFLYNHLPWVINETRLRKNATEVRVTSGKSFVARLFQSFHKSLCDYNETYTWQYWWNETDDKFYLRLNNVSELWNFLEFPAMGNCFRCYFTRLGVSAA